MSKDLDENGFPYHSSEEEEEDEHYPSRHDRSLQESDQSFDGRGEEFFDRRETRRAQQHSNARSRNSENYRHAAVVEDDSSIVESDDAIGSDWDFEEDQAVNDRVHYRQKSRPRSVRYDKPPVTAAVRQRREAVPAAARKKPVVAAGEEEEPVLREAGNPILVKGTVGLSTD